MTPEQVKANFRARGETLKAWSEENGYDPCYVSRVLHGRVNGNYGKSFEIAQKLGLREQPK
nr:MAG TPA: hypothetical protein [Caudoviricetes sp.]